MMRAVVIVTALLLTLPLGTAMAQQQGQMQTGAPDAAGRIEIASDSLVGSPVRDQQGKDIGQVKRLLIDHKDGKVTSLVIASGGRLGMGASEMAIPWDAVQIQHDQQKLVVTLQREMLQQAPKSQPQGSKERSNKGEGGGSQPSASPATTPNQQPPPPGHPPQGNR